MLIEKVLFFDECIGLIEFGIFDLFGGFFYDERGQLGESDGDGVGGTNHRGSGEERRERGEEKEVKRKPGKGGGGCVCEKE